MGAILELILLIFKDLFLITIQKFRLVIFRQFFLGTLEKFAVEFLLGIFQTKYYLEFILVIAREVSSVNSRNISYKEFSEEYQAELL